MRAYVDDYQFITLTMKRKNIKQGMEVIVRGIVAMNDETDTEPIHVETSSQMLYLEPDEIEPAPAKPKFNPKRKFRDGDCVQVVMWHGRLLARDGYAETLLGKECIVESDETKSGEVRIKDMYIHACCLELVKPVDEKKPRPPFYPSFGFDEAKVYHRDSPYPAAIFPCDFWSEARAMKEAREFAVKLNREFKAKLARKTKPAEGSGN